MNECNSFRRGRDGKKRGGGLAWAWKEGRRRSEVMCSNCCCDDDDDEGGQDKSEEGGGEGEEEEELLLSFPLETGHTHISERRRSGLKLERLHHVMEDELKKD